jgi:hypothetical protein
MFGHYGGQLFDCLSKILLMGNHKNILGRTNRGQPPESLLYQRFPGTKDVDKLFGAGITA